MPEHLSTTASSTACQRVHGLQRHPATAFQAAVHALRFIDDQDGTGLPNKVDGALTASSFVCAFAVDVVYVLLIDSTNRHHHDLDIRAGSEVANLSELVGVVWEKLIALSAWVETLEVVTGNFQCFVGALLDGDRGHYDDELSESVAPIQLEDRAQVNIGLARGLQPRLVSSDCLLYRLNKAYNSAFP